MKSEEAEAREEKARAKTSSRAVDTCQNGFRQHVVERLGAHHHTTTNSIFASRTEEKRIKRKRRRHIKMPATGASAP